MRPFLTLIVLIFALVVAGGVAAQDAPLNVVATTTILADIAANVGGDLLTVTPLLPVNTDTHAYQFTPQDVTRVADADLLLTVGAGYEGFLGGLLENAGDVNTVVVSNGVDILAPLGEHDHEDDHAHNEEADHADEADDHAHDEDHADEAEDHAHDEDHADEADDHAHDEDHADEADDHAHDEDHDHDHLGHLGEEVVCEAHDHDETSEEGEAHDHGTCDPHVWLDPANVMIWADNIADAFAAADPANADAYRANAAAYKEQLVALDTEIADLVTTLPEERRVLVTNHEFLNYFAHAYGFEVAATVLPGVSTSAEPSPQELTALIDLIRDEGVPAVFAEVSANAQLAEIVGQEAGVTVVTDLYTESLSDANGPAATYIDYMRHNANTIVTALAGA